MRSAACGVAVGLLVVVAAAAPPGELPRSLKPGEAGIVAVLARLRQTDVNDPAYAGLVVQLDRLSRPQDVPVLLRELPEGPTEPLIDTLARQWKLDRTAQVAKSTDPSPAVRRAALRAIGCGSQPTVIDLRPVADRLINDSDDAVRREAVVAVKDFGGVAFAKRLVDRLAQTPPARLADVVRLIAEQGDPRRNNFVATPSTPADAYAVTKKLEQLMTHADAAVRAAAVSHAPPSPTIWPTPAAARLADDKDAAVRLSLARTLRPASAGATPTALHLLDDADATVRGVAVDAVMVAPIMQGTFRPENAVARLADRVNDVDPFVRGRLKINPFVWNTSAVVAPFENALAGGRGPRLAALEAMAFGAPAALGPAIEKLLDDVDPVTRTRAFAAAGNLPLTGLRLMRFARAVLNDLDPSVRSAASEAMARMSRADMEVVIPKVPDGEPGFARKTTDLKIPPEAAAAHPRAVTLVDAYTDHLPIDKVLDLLGGDDANGVDAAVALLRDLADRPYGSLKPLFAHAAVRGGRAASMVGILFLWATRGDMAGNAPVPDEANALTRALRTAAAGKGRDAALARLALHETANEVSAAAALSRDPVPAVRAMAVGTMQAGRARGGVLPAGVLAALDDAVPAVARTAAGGVAGALTDYDKPPMEEPQPAADRLAAADATVRAAAVAESAKAAAGLPVFLNKWSRLMDDPDPAVRTAVAATLRQAYANRQTAGRR